MVPNGLLPRNARWCDLPQHMFGMTKGSGTAGRGAYKRRGRDRFCRVREYGGHHRRVRATSPGTGTQGAPRVGGRLGAVGKMRMFQERTPMYVPWLQVVARTLRRAARRGTLAKQRRPSPGVTAMPRTHRPRRQKRPSPARNGISRLKTGRPQNISCVRLPRM